MNIDYSYQWKKQEFVRQIYEDLNMRKVQTWFDIWYSMRGDTNDAMAIGLFDFHRLHIHRSELFIIFQVSNVLKYSLSFYRKNTYNQ